MARQRDGERKRESIVHSPWKNETSGENLEPFWPGSPATVPCQGGTIGDPTPQCKIVRWNNFSGRLTLD